MPAGTGSRPGAMRPACGSFLLALLARSIATMAVAVGTHAAAETRVGLAVPLTGRMAPVGLAMQRALEAAVAEANASGGVRGERLALLVHDDGCASATAAGAAGQLIAEKAVLVVGHPCSSAAVAAGPLYANAEALLIAVGARHPDVTRANGRLPVPVLRLAGRDDRQGDAAARWLVEHAPARRAAIVHDQTAYARDIAERTVTALKGADVEPVAVIQIAANRNDYDAEVLRLRASGAEAVLFAGYPDEAGGVLAGLRRIGLQVPVLGSDALATAAFAEATASARGTVQVLLPAGPASPADAASYVSGVQGAFEAWLAAARRAGTLDARTLSAALRGGPVATHALGEIRFDLNGDLDTHAFAAASARSGRWVMGGK